MTSVTAAPIRVKMSKILEALWCMRLSGRQKSPARPPSRCHVRTSCPRPRILLASRAKSVRPLCRGRRWSGHSTTSEARAITSRRCRLAKADATDDDRLPRQIKRMASVTALRFHSAADQRACAQTGWWRCADGLAISPRVFIRPRSAAVVSRTDTIRRTSCQPQPFKVCPERLCALALPLVSGAALAPNRYLSMARSTAFAIAW